MFVAVVPPPDVVEDLSDFLEPRRDVGMPWIHPAQWHATLAFMEGVSDRALDTVLENLAAAAARRRPFSLHLGGAGAFPDAVRAKVVWLGLRDGDRVSAARELDRLAVNVRAAVSSGGAAVDGKTFRPHVSLARLKRPVEATRWLRILDTYVGRTWQVDEFELVASHLAEGPNRRPRHETVARFRLGERGLPPGLDLPGPA